MVDPSHLTCPINGVTYASIEELHSFLKRVHVKRSDYYEEYFPRKDLLTGEVIKFKDYDTYVSQDFSSKVNLKKWLGLHRTEGKDWSRKWLSNRKMSKGLIYAPSQVELRSLSCPSMPYYEAMFDGGYYGLCKELGFASRYDFKPVSFTPLPHAATIICDTREQTPIKIDDYKVVREKLDVGDYGLAQPHDNKVYIERKSLSDFLGTLSSGYERFERELARAVESNSYLVMAVEVNINDAQSFEYSYAGRHTKVTASFIFHRLRELLTSFPLNFQVVFIDGRVEMRRVIVRLFEMGDHVKHIDLQYMYETKKL